MSNKIGSGVLLDYADTPNLLPLEQYAHWLKVHQKSLDNRVDQRLSLFLNVIVLRVSKATGLHNKAIEPRQSDPPIFDIVCGPNVISSLREILCLHKCHLVVLMPDDVSLDERASNRFICTAQNEPAKSVFYADSDCNNEHGRHSPDFKTAFDPILMSQRDPVGFPVVYRSEILKELCDQDFGPCDPDLLLYRIAISAFRLYGYEVFRHIPEVLASRKQADKQHVRAVAQDPLLQVSDFTRHPRLSRPVESKRAPDDFGGVRCKPTASLFVPTRDQPAFLKRTIDSILENTKYPAFEIIIVDNGTVNLEALSYLSSLSSNSKIKVIRDQRPFNFSQLNNEAAKHAKGEVFVLLNNDMSTNQADWLDRLVAWLHFDDVGVVGAKLIFEDGRVQHAGVAFGLERGFVHQMYLEDQESWTLNGTLMLSRSVSAVTGACLAIRADHFRQIGGLNEKLAVAYNDIDLCFNMNDLGFRVVYAADVVLTHYESVSRGTSRTSSYDGREAAELLSFWTRHADRYRAGDQWLNPNLAYRQNGIHLVVPPSYNEEMYYIFPASY